MRFTGLQTALVTLVLAAPVAAEEPIAMLNVSPLTAALGFLVGAMVDATL